jgi:xanthine dehydrogenase molybdenum-binding subunit
MAVRPDAADKVTGRAVFTDDLAFEGMLYARVKRAMVPHGILRKLDTSKAQASPGVVAVMTAADLPGARRHGLVFPDWPVLVGIDEKVCYEGDAIAILAAETQEAADQALALIEAEIEPLPVVSSAVQSAQADAPQLRETGNLMEHIKVRKGDLATGFAEADLTFEETFTTPTMDHAFMEPECSVAVPTLDGRMTVYVASQIPYEDRRQVAEALGWPEERVHIAGQTMGGGFGGKEDISGQIHSALLANVTGQPVKLLFDRTESLLVHPKRHATQITIKLGVRQDGHLTAAETLLYGDTGAYASLGDKVMTRATTHSAGCYIIPHTKADCYAMFTNNPPAGAFRGFGVIQASFAIESVMDMIARKLKLDPFALRRMNALRTGTRTNTNQLLVDSVGLVDCLDMVEARLHEVAGERPFEPIREVQDGVETVSTWGVAAAFKNTGLGSGADDSSSAIVELLPEGRFDVRSSAAELGQGLVAVLRMIVAEELDARPEDVDVHVMDTDVAPDGGPTTASRQTYVTGNAAKFAARVFRQKIVDFLVELYHALPEDVSFSESQVQVGDHVINLAQLYQLLTVNNTPTTETYHYAAPATEPLGTDGDIHFAFSFAVQAVQIEVNLESGEIKVLKVITANDAGEVINPLGFNAQVEGGTVMGVGHALMEEVLLEEGHNQTKGFRQYHIPGIMDTPQIDTYPVETPTHDGPYGAKGIGEIVSIPTPPAIANALYNAIGLRVHSLPIKAETVLEYLKQKA